MLQILNQNFGFKWKSKTEKSSELRFSIWKNGAQSGILSRSLCQWTIFNRKFWKGSPFNEIFSKRRKPFQPEGFKRLIETRWDSSKETHCIRMYSNAPFLWQHPDLHKLSSCLFFPLQSTSRVAVNEFLTEASCQLTAVSNWILVGVLFWVPNWTLSYTFLPEFSGSWTIIINENDDFRKILEISIHWILFNPYKGELNSDNAPGSLPVLGKARESHKKLPVLNCHKAAFFRILGSHRKSLLRIPTQSTNSKSH